MDLMESTKVPTPNFQPEELSLYIYDSEHSSILGEKLTPIYGERLKDGSSVSPSATTKSTSKYANWWINSNITNDDIKDISAFNMSGIYMISVDLKKSASTEEYRKIQYNGIDVDGTLYLYPDIYLSNEEYKGGLGYAITHVLYEGQIQRIIKDQKDKSRKDTVDYFKKSAEYMGHSDFSDPYSGEKFDMKNGITFIGPVSVMPKSSFDNMNIKGVLEPF